MKGLKQRRTLLAGIALILTSNAAVLAMAAYNRLGEPDSRVQLTERELWLPPSHGLGKESSGINLMLRYRVKGLQGVPYFEGGNVQASWLNSDKLTALGFDLAPSSAVDDNKRVRYAAWASHREVILVLEYDGDAYREAVAQAERQLAEAEDKMEHNVEKVPLSAEAGKYRLPTLRERLDALRTSGTRLYIIDAGLDRAALRQQYADGSRYLLMKGTVGLSFGRVNGKEHELHGVIRGLVLNSVHVPSSYREQLQPFMGKDRRRRHERSPRYSVEFNLGQRLEPWVSGVMALPGGGD